MIDFSSLQGLTIPEGVVTQITDESGREIWTAWRTSGNVIIEVEKITSNTYAGSTTYTDEEFILLDIYPKSGGAVKVTYGGLTKTITDDGTSEEPNAQQVYFGTFNGVSDSAETPASGTLTIEGDYAVFGCASFNITSKSISRYGGITAITDFGTVEYIPRSAFSGCTGLTSVTIPASVTSIDSYAFDGCTGLTSVTIPASVTSIGDGAFSRCTGLTSVTIPASVTSIGSNPWLGCFENNSITVANGNTAYKIDGNCLIEIASNSLIAGYKDSIIPSYITSIDSYAFSGCTGLTSVTIPASVTSIDSYAFDGCTGLTSVTIPASVTSIGSYVFDRCTALTAVTVLATTPPATGALIFHECTAVTAIVVPAGCGDAYKAASGWSNYADYIVEAS